MKKHFLFQPIFISIFFLIFAILILFIDSPRQYASRNLSHAESLAFNVVQQTGRLYKVKELVVANNQNSMIRVEPWYVCLHKILIQDIKTNNSIIVFGNHQQVTCTAMTFDLRSWLTNDHQRVLLFYSSNHHDINKYPELQISSVLFNGLRVSTLCCLILISTILILISYILRKALIEKKSIIIFLLAIIYYIYWFYNFPNTTYTNDWVGHLFYIQHMRYNLAMPFSYSNLESWHPITYYLISAFLSKLKPDFLAEITLYRVFGLSLFSIYLFFGFKTVQISLKSRKLVYFIALSLIAFWPYSVLLASRINNDLAFYAAASATIYYLIKWWNLDREQGQNNIFIPLLCLAITIVTKSNSIILVGIMGAIKLVALYKRKIKLSDFILPPNLLGIAFIIFALLLNSAKIILRYLDFEYNSFFYAGQYTPAMHLGGSDNYIVTLKHFYKFAVSNFVKFPNLHVGCRDNICSFWDFFLRTAIYGDFGFPYKYLKEARFLNLIFLIHIFINIISIFPFVYKKFRIHFYRLLPHYSVILFFIVASMSFMVLKKWQCTQDFRFCLPLCISWIIIGARNIEILQEEGYYVLPIVYIINSMAFIIGFPIFFVMQF